MILEVLKNRLRRCLFTKKTSKLFLLNNSNWTKEVGNKKEGICLLTISFEFEFWQFFNEIDSFCIPSWLISFLPWLKCMESSLKDSLSVTWVTVEKSLQCNNKNPNIKTDKIVAKQWITFFKGIILYKYKH